MKIFFFIVLVMHSLIHIVGFIKSFNLIELSELTNPIPRFQGALWLLTSILFFICLYGLWFDYFWWWMVAIPAVVLSQILIFLDWNEAWFGSIANFVVVISVILGYGQWNFDRMAGQKIDYILTVRPDITHLVDSNSVEELPEVVVRWLKRSGVFNEAVPRQVYALQTGRMRTSPEGRWMRFDAEQWYNVYEPAFVWKAHVNAFPGLHLSGLDSYIGGRGNMLIKAMGLLEVVDAGGPEIDQGTLLRFLAEMAWFPAAAVLPYLEWQELSDNEVRAIMTYGDVSADGVFQFSEEGDLLSFEALRYYDRGDSSSLERWIIVSRQNGWKEFDGSRLPYSFEVIWDLDEGKFTWLELEISELKYSY
ncbi:MAG: hypothetical protein EA409_01940 [Saprospirales bacterium]|nr:MAG: hypothetical protein EA409_01940 [Saprospirales bacterium]